MHSATSTSGDESSADDDNTAFKRQRTVKNGSEAKQVEPPRKERIPTHKLRKEQKMELLSQIEQLEDQLKVSSRRPLCRMPYTSRNILKLQ